MTPSLEPGYNPDVLSCIANLSNDEVFTPPSVANAMLDMLPQELFRDPNATFLDPACKSGVFLREIAKRLLKGLESVYLDLQERIDHIFKHQLFGLAITELTAHLSRRSLYCSKEANSDYSVTQFDTPAGNVRFQTIRHKWEDGRCVFCGASKQEYDRAPELESHAYELIHTLKPEKMFNMRFDVIIGNPPYQLSTGQGQSQALPLYHRFVEQAIKLRPHYLTMITPSRWFAGGMGLDSFRSVMLKDGRLRRVVDFSMSTDCFPGVDIAGGVNYFLWDSSYNGDCEYTYIDNGKSTTLIRKLDEFDVFVRNNNAINIVHKVMKKKEKNIGSIISSLGPFGLGTAERGTKNDSGNCYKLRSSAGSSYINRNLVKNGKEYIQKWKVIIGKATSAGAATANKKDGTRKVIATLDLLEPNEVCTFSYFIGGAFDDKKTAKKCQKYYSSKFVRFLLLQCLSSINISRDRFAFVPLQDFSKDWNDTDLYKKYELNEDEIALIENMIKPFEIGEND